MRKIRVLHILNRFNLGGPTYYAVYLTHFLPEDEFEAKLIGGRKEESELHSEFVAEQYDVHPVVIDSMCRSIGQKDFKAFRDIRKIIKEYKPDIVHTHASKAGIVGRLAAKTCGVKVIIHTFHGHIFDKYFNGVKSNFFIRVERFMALLSTKIIVLSENQYNDLVNKYKIGGPKKIMIMPLGLDLNKYYENQEEKRQWFRKAYNVKDDEIAISITGRLAPIKNHTMFLEAMKVVKTKTNKKIKIFIVGDGESHHEIEQVANRLNLTYANYHYSPDNKDSCPDVDIILTSWMKDIDYVNAGVDIVALTSLNEGTPGSLIEAQAANKPIVATRVGGVEDIIKENETGLLVDSGDVEGFAEKMLQLIEDDELRNRLSKNGAAFVNPKYSHLTLAKNMSNLYRELYNQKAKPQDRHIVQNG